MYAIETQSGKLTTHYPILIEEGSDQAAFGVIIPDLPGCFSAGDSLDEALEAVTEAAAAWINAALDAGHPVPSPSSLEIVRGLPDYQGWTVSTVGLATEPSTPRN